MWEKIKEFFNMSSVVFTISILGATLFELSSQVEILNPLEIIIYFVFICIGVGAYKLSRNLHFNLKVINYIIPYILSIGLIIGLNYVLENYLLIHILDLKKLISIYTVGYIIYTTVMILKNIRNQDKLHF